MQEFALRRPADETRDVSLLDQEEEGVFFLKNQILIKMAAASSQ